MGLAVAACGMASAYLRATDWPPGLATVWPPGLATRTGHPDRASRWSSTSTLNRYVDLAFFAQDEWFGTTDMKLGEITPKDAQSFAEVVGFWVTKLRGEGSHDVLAELANGYGITDLTAPLDLSADDLPGGADRGHAQPFPGRGAHRTGGEGRGCRGLAGAVVENAA